MYDIIEKQLAAQKRLTRITKILKYIKYFIVYGLLGLLAGLSYLIYNMPPQPIPTSYYKSIKFKLSVYCPTLQTQIHKFITNDGILSVDEYKIFDKSCRVVHELNNPPKIQKKKKVKGLFT